jgi:hypothetical protein
MQEIIQEVEKPVNKKYSFNELTNIRETIERMSKFNQIEVLRIFNKYNNVTINENKYGIHINLSELNENIIDELIIYIKYIKAQEIELNNTEKEKENYKNIYFMKDNKDNNTFISNS